MIKYILAAIALKTFSISPLTTKIYRKLGNKVGAKKRATGQIPIDNINRVNRILQLNKEFGIPNDGALLMELGTGWLHWEAITTRLFFDIKAELYDVWDNRQLDAMKNYLNQLDSRLNEIDASESQRDRAHKLIQKINSINSFDELYDLLQFKYQVDPEGKPAKLGLNKFDLIISNGVLEHVSSDDVPQLIQDISNLLKPGGYSIHYINIRDHLCIYDKKASPKQYIAYSEAMWKACFENQVQYMNRLQRSEWLNFFEKAGMKLIKEEVEDEFIPDNFAGTRFYNYNISDLKCGGQLIIHRKSLD